jgi:hypothetical protein
MPGIPSNRQRDRATDAGATVIYDAETDGLGAREAWIKSLRSTDTAVIDRLALLAHPKSAAVPRPSADFTGALVRLMQRGCRIVEAHSGVSSDAPEAFVQACVDAANQVAAGRRLTSARARKMGEPGRRRNIENSAAVALQRPDMKRELAAIRSMWRNRSDYPHRDEAAAAINAMLHEKGLPGLGSAMTLYRLLGGRGRR